MKRRRALRGPPIPSGRLGGVFGNGDAFENPSDADMDGAFDVTAGAATALARAGGAGLRQNRADLARATSAIRAAAEAVVSLPGRARATAVRADSTLDLPAGQDVAGADDHA